MSASTPSQQTRSRIVWLDVVRFIATLQIIGFHWVRACVGVHLLNAFSGHAIVEEYFNTRLGWGTLNYMRLDTHEHGLLRIVNDAFALCFAFGWEFVNVFIVVSGLSIALTLPQGVIAWGSWVRRRVARIVFPYYLVAAPYLIFFLIAIHVGRGSGIVASATAKLAKQTTTNPTELLLSHLFFFDPLARHGMTRFFAPAWWFIPAILVAYLCTPLFIGVLRRLGAFATLSFSLLVTIASYIATSSHILTIFSASTVVLNECFSFTLGLVFGTLLRSAAMRERFEREIMQQRALLLALVSFVIGNIGNWFPRSYCVSSPFITVGATILTIQAAILVSRSPSLHHRISGDAYFLYLVHQPLAFPIALVAGYLVHGYGIITGFILYLVSTLALASAFEQLYARLHEACLQFKSYRSHNVHTIRQTK